MGQLRHRLCIDHHLGQAKRTEFKCRIQSTCEMTQVLESPVLVVESNGKASPESNQYRKAPLITLISSSRIEFSGKFVQLFCNAAGNPRPEIEWKVVDSQDEGILYPIEDFPFVWTINNSDILVDTSKTDVASVTFKCVARNRFGNDSANSTLVLITNE
uniref:Ig-like domain-containing protein n=1 Tax=Acrobeloides nanus TaxID=290746 RepID=A0A914BX58_9BILA